MAGVVVGLTVAPPVRATLSNIAAIARAFGGRDHTTVIHAVERIGTLMPERRQIYDEVTELIQRIKSNQP